MALEHFHIYLVLLAAIVRVRWIDIECFWEDQLDANCVVQ